jgi:putative acetyltransferase
LLRTPEPAPVPILRPERAADAEAIGRLLRAAFEGPDEAAIVERIRSRAAGYLALVAEIDGQLVGHIAFSPMTMEPDRPELGSFGLAPLAVLPEFQGQGIGSRLSEAGLAACRAAGARAVFVLGHPDYYARFGFALALDRGITCVYDAPKAFMVLELEAGALDGVTGIARYHPALEG